MNQTMILLSSVTFLIMLTTCNSVDTIAVNQNITDAETIFSGNGRFELGFFSPGNSTNRYLGIWFKNTLPRTVIWVANRETPLIDPLGIARLDSQGILSIVNDSSMVIWSSDSSVSSKMVNQPRAQLLDTGNLVIKDENSVIWQSFDHPGDTFISGMRMGKNFITGREVYITSWRSTDDPSPGEYTVKLLIVKGKYPQLYYRKRSVIVTRIGPFDGIQFAGLPSASLMGNNLYTDHIVINENEMYYTYTSNSTTISFRTIVLSHLTPGGKLEVWQLDTHKQEWMQALTLPLDYCDNYGLCGPNGICSTATFPYCRCLKGFEQEILKQSTGGCVRSRALDCGPGEGFLKFSSMKLPDTQNAVYDGSMSLQACKVACKNNCSCTAYANPNVSPGGVGCLLWFGDLIDVRIYSANGQDLYVRVEASELLGYMISESTFNKKKQLIILITASPAMVLLLTMAYACRGKKKTPHLKQSGNWYGLYKQKTSTVQMEDLDELLFFTLHELAKATDNFSINNKIGEGGFGPVYKGVLEDGQEVAIKRLAETSHQGLDEFKNEVLCIAKLQHRNLVKLLGYCIHENEMILIYEFMLNKSLDTFLFDETRTPMINWRQRFNIIQGMARGILYLHQDSRLHIIHRDLKAGNILLDDEMNPKISDFGLARKFVGSDIAVRTKKVVGTHGYISPEYALYGRFSIKSDVFSFGVLVLEIVSGKQNKEFCHEGHSDNLLGHAWRLYQEGRSIELMSASLHDTCVVSEVLRSIHVALLCVQHHAEDRPTMLTVVLMLVSEGVLPQPKQPGFFAGESHSQVQSLSSFNECTITQLHAR